MNEMRDVEYWIVTFDDLTCIYRSRQDMRALVGKDAGGRQGGRVSRMIVRRPQ